MKNNLVIVESPAKAKTLGKILGKGYSLKASLGHIRDLPRSRLGVAVDKGFTPQYVIPRIKNKIVKELKEAAAKAKAVYLATDPDREGEAISWHLLEVTKNDNIPYRRVVFHEITQDAVEQAFQHPRTIDMKLVDAQQARRVLDRLVGYKISPLLWKKVQRGLSAGRVQSVAVSIIVDREREIQNFKSEEYWTIEAELSKKKAASAAFRAQLIGLAGGTKLDIHNEAESNQLKDRLETAGYKVLKVATKKALRQPAPPFITSTMQQEAWRKLRFSARQTMQIAQQLYEGLPIGSEGEVGLITYMRTDSTHVAASAITETRDYIGRKYGEDYLPPKARVFTRAVKGAQEAHEAIRPTRTSREPALIKRYLTNSQFRLYQLIWQRMVASQMSAAVFDNTTVDINAAPARSKDEYLLRAASSVNVFPGFIVLYIEDKDDAEKEDKPVQLPSLAKGDELKLLGLFAEQRFTQPPSRYTEASLVKMLEQEGIGRPSTYAPILSTIQERGYVTKTRGIFQPTELGVLVNDLLHQYFAKIVDVAFTAHMEEELDEIAHDNRDWVSVIQDFYTPFEKDLENASSHIEKVKPAAEITEELCPKCGKPLAIKMGRFGKFYACTGYPECKFTKSFQVKTGVACPECGGQILERRSKKGRTFYGCGNYPKCKFATFNKPLPQRCPQCGSLLTEYRDKWAKCTKCEFRCKLEDLKPATVAPEPAGAKSG